MADSAAIDTTDSSAPPYFARIGAVNGFVCRECCTPDDYGPVHRCPRIVRAVRCWHPWMGIEESSARDLPPGQFRVADAAAEYVRKEWSDDPDFCGGEIHVRGDDGAIYLVEVSVRCEPVFCSNVTFRAGGTQ